MPFKDAKIILNPFTGNLDVIKDSIALSNLRYEQDLVGTKNGINLVFTTPEDFIADTIQLYYLGQRLKEGIGNDYVTSESGGPLSGFDTVTLASDLAPFAGDNLFADYLVP